MRALYFEALHKATQRKRILLSRRMKILHQLEPRRHPSSFPRCFAPRGSVPRPSCSRRRLQREETSKIWTVTLSHDLFIPLSAWREWNSQHTRTLNRRFSENRVKHILVTEQPTAAGLFRVTRVDSLYRVRTKLTDPIVCTESPESITDPIVWAGRSYIMG